MAFQEKMSTYTPKLLLVSAAILLFLAQSSYWVNHTIFNQKNFTKITTETLLTESSRDAIASAAVNKIFEDRPILQNTISEQVTAITSGLLGSDLSKQAIERLTSKVYAYATTENRQDIAFDLVAIKEPLSKVVTLVRGESEEQPILERIPDEIVLVESDSFPNVSNTVRTMLWLGPLFWLGTIGLFGIYIYRGRNTLSRQIYTVGFTIIAVALIGLIVSPFVPPPITSIVSTIEVRPVVESLTINFLEPFRVQMLYMLGVTAFVLLIYSQRYNMLHLLKVVEQKLNATSSKQTK